MRYCQWQFSFFCSHRPRNPAPSQLPRRRSGLPLRLPIRWRRNRLSSYERYSIARCFRRAVVPPAPPPRPPPIVPAAEPPAPPPPPPNLVLFGVVMDGEGARAVVRSGADKKLVRAQIGDKIDGGKVSQSEGRKVVLSLDGRFATFTLFSDDRGKSESAGGSAPVGAPKNLQRQNHAKQGPAQAAASQPGQPKKRRRSRE